MKKRTAFKKWLKARSFTVEDFATQARKRGLDVKVGTARKWMQGTEPRPFTMSVLVKAFPSIKF